MPGVIDTRSGATSLKWRPGVPPSRTGASRTATNRVASSPAPGATPMLGPATAARSEAMLVKLGLAPTSHSLLPVRNSSRLPLSMRSVSRMLRPSSASAMPVTLPISSPL